MDNVNLTELVERLSLLHKDMTAKLDASYKRSLPVCCGYDWGMCCGVPETSWSDEDRLIMETLAPFHKKLKVILADMEQRLQTEGE